MTEIKSGDRVEIPVWSDWWMSGSRYGEVLSLRRGRAMTVPSARVQLDNGRKATFAVEDLRRMPSKTDISIIDKE